MDEEFANFDRQFCGRVARITAIVCIVFVLTAVVVLTVANPPASCPDWHIRFEQDVTLSIWALVGLQAATAIWVCFVALDWQLFSERIASKLRSLMSSGSAPGLLDFDAVYFISCAGWGGFCSIPLWIIAFKCL
jgi:hypothetical protein